MRGMSFFAVVTCGVFAHAVLAAQPREPAAKPKIDTYVGAGPYVQTQPYQDADPIALPTPVIFFDNRLLYVRWTRVGLYVYGKQNWGVSLTAQPRPWGFQGEDSARLSGMAERLPSWEAGVALGGKNPLGFAELTFFHDILDRSNGSLVRLEIGKTFTSGRWFHMPSLFVIRYSDAMLNYYYGVRPQESIPQRPAYEAKAGINFALQHFFTFEMTKQWFVSANVRIDYLAATITRSPIVDDQWMGSAMASLLYKFAF
ncbi:MAG: MipA/OmpV family protein [Gammaproteobacteria bacterium]